MWRSEALVSDAVGRIIEFWGFKRNMGRVWSVLYLADAPLSAQDLRERLGLSAGGLSMTIHELSRWGVVKKVSVPGERRDYFSAEINIWKMVSRVLAEREKVEILDAIDAMQEALEYAEGRALRGDPQDRARARFQQERIHQLLSLARLGERLLDTLLRQGRVDVRPLLDTLLGRGSKKLRA